MSNADCRCRGLSPAPRSHRFGCVPRTHGFTVIPRPRGFTLIELIVALFITAIVFAIGYGGLNEALQHRDEIKQHEDRLSKVQIAVETLVQDFAQVSARPVRDPLGTNWLPCFSAQPTQDLLDADGSGGSSSGGGTSGGGTSGDTTSGDTTSGDTTSGDTTSGDTSAAGSSASGTDDTGGVDLVVFTRAGWANPAGIQRSTLERVSYRFNDGKLWRMHWEVLDDVEGSQPVHRELLDHVKSVSFRFMNDSRQWVTQWPATGNSAMRTRPFAVEVTLELTDWGRIVRVIEVPA